MYEVVGGAGACYKTSPRADMGEPLGKVSIATEGGELTVQYR